MNKSASESLKLIRIYDFRLIPRYLFDQVKPHNEIIVDELYGDWGATIAKSPLSLLYAMADNEYKTRGVLWATVDPITKAISVPVLSLDKAYQDRQSIKHAMTFLVGIRDKLGFRKIIFSTTRPKAYARFGCNKSKQTLMEV